jgi:apolipoprotein N-acyltransferase
MTPVAAPERDATSSLGAHAEDRLARYPLVAGLASGFLLWASFPPVEWSWLAWIALVPLFWLAILRGNSFKLYAAAWMGGLAFWLLAVEWLRMTASGAWIAWLAVALVFSLWWPLFLALCRWAVFRLELPLLLAAPIIWVGLEFARAYFLTGLPWYYLAHSQFRRIYLIQIADVAGSLGISLLIAVLNALVVDFLTLPLFHASRRGARLLARQNVRLCMVTILVGASLCYGAFRVSTARFHDGPRVALLQSNIEQRHKVEGDPTAILAEFIGLIESATSQNQNPDLLVWPETGYPYRFICIDPALERSVLERQVRSITEKLTVQEWLDNQKYVAAQLHLWTDTVRVPMLVGSICYDHLPTSVEKYNSAILFRPDDPTLQFYHKMHLVPFGEYFPLIESLPWLAVITPYRGQKLQSLSFGRDPIVLSLGEYHLAVSICFEDTVPQVVRRFFRETDQGHQPDVLVNLSNDGWFHGSAELDMHLAIGVFRAVEHRVPLVRAVNTGLSALVDGNGEIRETLPKEAKGVLSVTVPLDDRTTFYTRYGDWLGLSCLAISIGLFPMGWIWKKRGSRRNN